MPFYNPAIQFYKRITLYNECRFWLRSVSAGVKIMQRLIEQCRDVKASSIVTAEVAKAAGDLSLLVEQFKNLSGKIEEHNHRILQLTGAEAMSGSVCSREHSSLHKKVMAGTKQYRSIIRKLFELEESAYKRFIY